MSGQAIAQTQTVGKPTFTPVAGYTLQRACACGQHSGNGGECEECKKKREGALQRSAVNAAPTHEVPPIVHEVLRSPGRPLDAATRAFMEPRFGHDFSSVRVHTDAKAAESARAVNALAYTVGQSIVFDDGLYSPNSLAGRSLLAHELVHTVQQAHSSRNLQNLSIDAPDSGLERAADQVAQTVLSNHEWDLSSTGEFTAVAVKNPVLSSLTTQPTIQRVRRPLCHHDRLTREQYLQGITWLEEQGHITTEEAEALREHIPDSRRVRCRTIDGLVRRAQRGRRGVAHTRHGRTRTHLISNFQVTPRNIRVDEGEAARISFDVTGSDISAIEVFILKYEFSSELPDSRFFDFSRSLTPGHKVAVWDGTFTGSRREAPEPGTYRVRVSVSDHSGHHEEVFEQIRVLNPTRATVLPRTGSGLALHSLEFNGSVAVLTDTGGNTIRARAVSGLRPNNPHNPEHRDYTDSRDQCLSNKGPIPAGQYFIDANTAQQPELDRRGRLRYPSGGGARGWGPFRAPLRPANPAAVCGRSGFFFHLDVTDDGTAGCIGISKQEEAKFNQMVALMMRMPTGNNLPVNVKYP
jgi:hypothetical protein